MLIGFAAIALLPLLIEQLGSGFPLVPWDADSTSHASRPGRGALTKSLLIFAVGTLTFIPALFRSRFAGMVILAACLMVLMSAATFDSKLFTAVSLSVLALSLPLTYLLIQRSVALGRAPRLSELLRP